MKIAVFMSLYNESHLIEHTLDSMLGNTKHECDVYVYLSGSRFFQKNLTRLKEIINLKKNYQLIITGDGEQIRNAPVWGTNDILHEVYENQNYDMLVGGAPDYLFYDRYNVFDSFVDQATPHLNNKYTISCLDEEGSNVRWACIIYTKKMLNEVGYLDPNFVPMNNSDSDLHRRCLITHSPERDLEYYNSGDNYTNPPYGVNIVVPSCNLSYGSYGARGSDLTHFLLINTFNMLNHAYYVHKWGGSNTDQASREKYIMPFNDPEIPLKISYEQATNLNSKYDRHDVEICSII